MVFSSLPSTDNKNILSNRNISGQVSSSVGWQEHLLRPKTVLRQNFADCLGSHICSEDIQGTALTKLDGVEASAKFWCHSTFPPTRARRCSVFPLCSECSPDSQHRRILTSATSGWTEPGWTWLSAIFLEEKDCTWNSLETHLLESSHRQGSLLEVMFFLHWDMPFLLPR